MKNPLEKIADSQNDIANKGCFEVIVDDLKIVAIIAIISLVIAIVACGPLGLGLSASSELPPIDNETLLEVSKIYEHILSHGAFLGSLG